MDFLKLGLIILVFIIVSFFLYWQNHDIVTSSYTYKNKKIPKSMNGYKIIHISDLHFAEFGRGNKNLLRKIKIKHPDIIVITGDIIDNSKNINSSLLFAESASKIAPVYYVTGNHEYYMSEINRIILIEGLKKRGVNLLCDKTTRLFENCYLIGLDDQSLENDTLKALSHPLPADALKIVLAHKPHHISLYAQNEADLVLCGHAHGGQIRLPFIGGIFSPGQGLFPKYTAGMHRKSNTDMIVSRGLGNSVFPFRVFNRPELVCIVFHSTHT
ncbi:MAG: metallophosphoesterase [Bacillota bacterium]|nr:metallophosphoesterase [Bacillota bacterium]